MSKYTIAIYDTQKPDSEVGCYLLSNEQATSVDDLIPVKEINIDNKEDADLIFDVVCEIHKVAAKFDNTGLLLAINKNKGAQ